jgi:inorganic pyrophosphatase
MNKINFILQIISILLFSKFVFANDQNLISDIKIYNEDKTINAVIEIPAGTLEKWEISKDGKKIEQEIYNSQMRKINYLAYPFNYGFVPQTVIPVEEGGDGDQLDIIIIGPTIKRGSIVKVKPIGAIIAVDNNEIDTKIVSVAVNDLEISRINSINDLKKNYLGLFDIILTWIENYKGEVIEIKNTIGKKATFQYINKHHEKYLINKNDN